MNNTANSAEQLLQRAAEIMTERGAQYDSTGQQRERSMGRIVSAFNALYGTSMTEQQGWHFMVLLKLARQQAKPHADSMEDAIAYAALAGEAGFMQLGAMPTPQHLPQADVLANYEATAQELTRELGQARSEIFSLEQALKHSVEQRESLYEQVLEATVSADKWHDKANSLENSLRISEQAANDKIQQLEDAIQRTDMMHRKAAAEVVHWHKAADKAQAEAAEYRERCVRLNTKLENLLRLCTKTPT